MIKVGVYNKLAVQRSTQVGVFLEDGKDGLLVPKRFVPARTKVGDILEVFVYHDSEDRLIATTQKPFAIVGEIAMLRAVSVTNQGAFRLGFNEGSICSAQQTTQWYARRCGLPGKNLY